MLSNISKHKCSKTAISLIFAMLIILLNVSLTSCTNPYKQFSSSDQNIDFTFEYPSDLSTNIQTRKDWPDSPNGLIEIMLESSTANIFIDIFDVTADYTPLKLQQGSVEQAKSWEEKFKLIKNLEILKQDTIPIDGVTGYDLEMKYTDIKKSASIGNDFQGYDRNIFLQHNGRVYGLRFIVRASQDNSIKSYQHLLDTWKWKQ
jgi:hypothetical protein